MRVAAKCQVIASRGPPARMCQSSRLQFKLGIKSLIKSQLSSAPGPLKRRLNSLSLLCLLDLRMSCNSGCCPHLGVYLRGLRKGSRLSRFHCRLQLPLSCFLLLFFLLLLSNRETNLLSASLVWPWHHTWRPASAGGRPNEFASFKSSPSAKKRRQRPPRRSLIRHSHHRWRSGGLQPKIGIKIDHVKSLGGPVDGAALSEIQMKGGGSQRKMQRKRGLPS